MFNINQFINLYIYLVPNLFFLYLKSFTAQFLCLHHQQCNVGCIILSIILTVIINGLGYNSSLEMTDRGHLLVTSSLLIIEQPSALTFKLLNV